MKAASPLYSILLKFLLATGPYARGRLLQSVYWRLHDLWAQPGPPVRLRLHGFPALVNRGNMYPFIFQNAPFFNAPLVQLVHMATELAKRPLLLVDVGASFGDTVLLLKQRCPRAVGRFICLEGDAEFFALLTENMRQFDDVLSVEALLSREPMGIRALVKHHEGTASALGAEVVQAVPLDSLPCIANAAVDILKTDVDGFDGEVLGGAVQTLRRCQPLVIFEWHPKLIAATGNEPLRAFEVLQECGYERMLWFENPGRFSHFSRANSPESLKTMQDYLLAINQRADDHFDVVALPRASRINEIDLAAMVAARASASSGRVTGK